MNMPTVHVYVFFCVGQSVLCKVIRNQFNEDGVFIIEKLSAKDGALCCLGYSKLLGEQMPLVKWLFCFNFPEIHIFTHSISNSQAEYKYISHPLKLYRYKLQYNGYIALI